MKERKKQFKCEICNAEFGQDCTLNKHIAAIHKGRKHFKCDICNAKFTSKHGMKGHIATLQEGKKQTQNGTFHNNADS